MVMNGRGGHRKNKNQGAEKEEADTGTETKHAKQRGIL